MLKTQRHPPLRTNGDEDICICNSGGLTRMDMGLAGSTTSPATPLLTPNGVADKLELRAQLRVGPRRVLSDLTSIRVLPAKTSEDTVAANAQLVSGQ